MLLVQILAQDLEDLTAVHPHAVVRLNPLLSEVDGSGGPVGIVMVHGNEDDVFGEDIDLCSQSVRDQTRKRQTGSRTFFVHFASLAFSYPWPFNFAQKNVLK